MPRARNIKPGFFKNEGLGGLPLGTRLLFIGLWTLADREGRLEDRPGRIKAELFPYDCGISAGDIDSWLNSLASSPEVFILRYTAEKSSFILISNFTKHQNPHIKEQASTIPAPDENCAFPVEASGMHQTDTVQTQGEHLPRQYHAPPDSLNPDSLNPYISSDKSASPGDKVASSPSRRGRSSEDPATIEWFENEFWPRYPRKDNRKNALKVALTHGSTAPLRAAILKGLIAQLPELNSRARNFIPLASTWLNGERWSDSSDPVTGRRPDVPVDRASEYPPVPTYDRPEETDVD